MKNQLLLAEKTFTVISLLQYLGGPMALILSGGENEGQTSSIASYALIQMFFFVNYAISLVLLSLRWKNVLYVMTRDRFNTMLIGVVVMSVLWSAAPAVTSVRIIALIGTTLFGLYLATRYSLREQLQLLAWTFGIAIVLSLLFAIVIPKYGIMSGIHAGKWRGIFTHKNALGKSMVLSGLVFLLLALDQQKNKFLCWGGLLLSIFLLVISQSSSAIATLLIIFGTFVVIRMVRLPYLLMVPTLLLLIIVGIFANFWLTSNTTALLGSIGKDATLTGRTDLWPAVLDKIWERPWLGYGYSGFWGNWDSESVYIWRVTGWDPPNAHNGMLDILLDLGLLGLGTYLLGFLFGLGRGLAYVRQHQTADAFWPIMYLLYFWFSNQTESGFLRQNEIYWLLYVVVTLSLIPPKPLIKMAPKSVTDLELDPSALEDRTSTIRGELVRTVSTAFSTLVKTENRSATNKKKVPLDRKAAVTNFFKGKKK
jgi:exopolysaccharide production protein ExoQ